MVGSLETALLSKLLKTLKPHEPFCKKGLEKTQGSMFEPFSGESCCCWLSEGQWPQEEVEYR